VAGFGGLRLAVAGSGCLWLAVAGCGWLGWRMLDHWGINWPHVLSRAVSPGAKWLDVFFVFILCLFCVLGDQTQKKHKINTK